MHSLGSPPLLWNAFVFAVLALLIAFVAAKPKPTAAAAVVKLPLPPPFGKKCSVTPLTSIPDACPIAFLSMLNPSCLIPSFG